MLPVQFFYCRQPFVENVFYLFNLEYHLLENAVGNWKQDVICTFFHYFHHTYPDLENTKT